jgi:outer membrane protein insertion porin family/translocation and assembly module TamA
VRPPRATAIGTSSSAPRGALRGVLLGVLLGAGGALLPAVRPLAAQGNRDNQIERPQIGDVVFRGVESVSRGALAEGLATQESRCASLTFRVFCLFSKSDRFYQRRYLDDTELARDVVRILVFYYRRGWRDAQVDTAVTRTGSDRGNPVVRVTFTVREGPATRVTSVTVGDTLGVLAPTGRRRLVGLRRDDPLDLLRLDTAVVRLREAYWERGYGNAVVERPVIDVDTAAHTASVRIPVSPGTLTPVAEVDIVHLGGTRKVSDAVIRRSLTLEPGDLFKRSEIGRSQRALYESGLFTRAVIDTAVVRDERTGQVVCAAQAIGPAGPASEAAAAAPDTTKSLAVCVEEGPFRDARLSAGFTTADFAQVEGRYSNNYWLGGPRRLDLSGVLGNLGADQLYRTFPFTTANGFNQGSEVQRQLATSGRYFAPTYSVGADVRQRFFQSTRNTIGVGIFAHRRSSPAVFIDRGYGANASFTRTLTAEVPASLTYRFEENRVEAGNVYFCVNFGICDALTTTALARPNRLSPLALQVAVNRTNDPFTPSRGMLGRALVEVAGRYTFSDFAYARGLVEASTYRRLPAFRRSVLAVRGRLGYVQSLGGTNRALGLTREELRGAIGAGGDVLHPRTRFYAGGGRSVRGFGENQLGPRVLTVSEDAIRGLRTTNQGRDSSFASDPAQGGAAACAQPGAEALLACFQARRLTLGDGQFVSRPLGGTTLLEGNVELRVPIAGALTGALFVDGAVLGEGSLTDATVGTRAITPGFGVRYRSPVGPVRVDVGFRPAFREVFPVVTEIADTTTGERRLLELARQSGCRDEQATGCRLFPNERPTGFRAITQRLTLHLSIGEAF